MFNIETKRNPLALVLAVYGLCFLCRILEYFILRTDQTFWGEAFLHKLAGIAILLLALRLCQLSLKSIGFGFSNGLGKLLGGLAFGLLVFLPAYLTEMALLAAQNKTPSLEMYVSAYAVDGNSSRQTALIFFLICLLGNIINVIMEEGVFRGLFQKLLENKYSFIAAACFSAILFGFWHIMAPLRSYYDGTMSFNGLIANALLLVSTSALVGFKFSLLTKLTNSLYMAMGHHFINNAIVNMLHVVSSSGADELMVLRISIAQAVSFIIVLIWYILAKAKHSAFVIS